MMPQLPTWLRTVFLQLNPPSPSLQIPRIPSLSFKGFPDSRRGHQILSPICFLPEPLPKPTLRAWPSWVVPPRSSVRLQCQTPTKNVNFALRKGNILLDFSRSPASKEGLAEFHLTGLRTSHAGDYTCECYRPGAPDIRSPPSEVILLLVTGGLPKPSLQAHQRGVVTAGDDVTLQCQRPDNVFGPMRFALLKAGTAGPIRLRTLVGKEADFSLQTVTVGDAGNYSCVYFQTGTPFWASQPSDRLEIRVRGEVFTIGITPAGLPARSGAGTVCLHKTLQLGAVIWEGPREGQDSVE
ncbi:T-cell-interacting, activating receptor on myeloid cells protein 1-like [Neofelis nebulosa]|uniref:T-cell-interacting, activating receptor on myeloid cells protein 1-like n=1 Tax=Neofelis nebulosa TaxID=61452 RepID=UPI00272B9F2F|nr:T-cell-interacting, activating receptor on myeloid cells protein 1-like [Neofelis nebulosa]